ncbi:hypothetical protein AURDEDRAFT_142407 [Auricularia subglabra TFB-10046 SS5]|nr:hypothetical protein AURDEDRAFT_142407 [Auricularia subglabra TFB-10046 SS5]
MDEYVDRVLAPFPDWEDITTTASVRAARDALLAVSPKAKERAYYGPTTKLLNVISLCVFDARRNSCSSDDRDAACIFTSRPDHAPPGDIFDTQCRPDYPSFFGTRNELLSATTKDNYVPVRPIPWPEIGTIGEQKAKMRHGEGSGQFKTYMVTHALYRPDLPTVYGILVSRGFIQLSQLNACGMWSSGPLELRERKQKRDSDGKPLDIPEEDEDVATRLAPWIAFVYLAYRSYDQRDRKLSYNARQDSFPRWDVVDMTGRDARKTYALTPFYSAPIPGRGTFAAFQVADTPLGLDEANKAFRESEVKGFWKTSWQQLLGSKERELLDRLHGPDRWIPGLVRVYPLDKDKRLQVPLPGDIVRQARDADQVVHSAADGEEQAGDDSEKLDDEEEEDSDEDELQAHALTGLSEADVQFVERDQEILHIASIGEPLSQCETPREILYAMYDLLETYDHLLDHDLIHRDVSWFNVMCKPRHHIGKDTNSQERPCIRKLMQDVLGQSDGKPPVSSVLLADLDHAIYTKDIGRKVGLRERTGTPMFISIELSEFRCAVYGAPSQNVWDKTLLPALTAVKDTSLLLAAFPKDDGKFMDNLLKVKDREMARTESVTLSVRPRHNPRHDGESIFWVFLWAFLRARPRGALPENNDALRLASTLCKQLLAHKIGSANNASDQARMICFHCPEMLANFHSSLHGFEKLFIAMASYLQIPWHLYHDIVEPNHVQVAFRRMVLGYVLDKELLAALDTALDTECPRPILQDETAKPTERKKTPRSDSVVGGTGRSSVADELQPAEDDKRPKKRKASGQPGRGSAPKKRAGPGRKPQLPGIPADALSKDVADDGNLMTAATKYHHDLHLNDRSAYALRLKVWKDRNLWFGKGT